MKKTTFFTTHIFGVVLALGLLSGCMDAWFSDNLWSTIEVSGFVYDELGTPIEDAYVQILYEDEGASFTDSEGFFQASGSYLGDVSIIVTKPGFKYFSEDFSLSEIEPFAEIKLETELEGYIGYDITFEGYTLDSNDSPLPNTLVEIDGHSTISNSSGFYQLTKYIDRNPVFFQISKSGFHIQSTHLEIDNRRFHSDFKLNATHSYTSTISGTINSSNGGGINEATVSFNGQTVTTNSSGSYSITIEHDGDILVDVSASGHQSYQTTISSTETSVTFNRTLTTNTVTYTTAFSGTISSSNGGGIPGAVVFIDSYSTTTNSSGQYSLQVSHDGSVIVNISASGYNPESTTINTTSSSRTFNSTLTAIVATYTTTFSGKISDPIGFGISGAFVSINGYSTTTDNYGYYTLTLTHSGTVAVSVSASGYLSYSTTINTTNSNASFNKWLQFEVVSYTTTVSGFVRDSATYNGISGAQVNIGNQTVFTSYSGFYSATITHDGSFQVSATSYDYYTKVDYVSTLLNDYQYNFSLNSY
jgi:hypothetical protein